MFFPLIFPQFIDFNANYISQFLILITTYIVLDFLSLIGYAILANKLIIWIKANPKVINTISACVLIIIAIILIFTLSSCSVKKTCPGETPWRWSEIQNLTHE